MTRQCEHCGELFEPYIRRPEQKFCSKRCGNRYHYERNKEERKALSRQHYWKNPESEKEKSRRYYQENAEYCKERQREYRRENIEACREYDRKRRKQRIADRQAELSDQVLYWTEEALWAENTEDPEICISVASEIPRNACWLSEELEDFVSRWLDPDY